MNSICSRGLNNNTLEHEIDIHKGLQWVIYDATHPPDSFEREPLRLNREIISIISKLWIQDITANLFD